MTYPVSSACPECGDRNYRSRHYTLADPRVCVSCGTAYRKRSDVVATAVTGLLFALVTIAVAVGGTALALYCLLNGPLGLVTAAVVFAFVVLCVKACIALFKSTILGLRGATPEEVRGFSVRPVSAQAASDEVPSAAVWKK